ncbi:zinc metallopeptidase [Meiothermus taiwanensis]|uniref:Peptidase membrane zinc metallopeptidase putative n=2 Tax=Meiothermus taiwanensis TaxID=172827 RepID=A0ABM6WHC9_9DEIN|nr:zinc metallopeptidase [Meiothermus taiwanensis]AWR86398.1 peptidase membrane zinc metallopeptidase putative [Meiothermus taiwanensis WR-220]KIQ53868.1 Zn-dependent protease [Meiothermus taiwanensis]KZK16486.1 Zn-dependent protease [Meiothermus taiwanensis]RIH76541.1 putative neutral zinc metallopeptidase [Meiothermus taiwanensis]
MTITFLLMIAVFVATLFIQFWLQRTYARYSRVANSRGVTGEQVARAILDAYGLHNVRVEMVPGALTDHYDPIAKAVRLSEPNFHSPSAAALAVAAHEVGHAIQDAKSYAWLRVRHSILPVANIGSMFGPWIFILGMFMGATGLMNIGIWLFAAAALFQLVTLPVEFDASNRALNILKKMNFLDSSEMNGARAVLTAAAMTYVAALANSLATILHYVAIMTQQRE